MKTTVFKGTFFMTVWILEKNLRLLTRLWCSHLKTLVSLTMSSSHRMSKDIHMRSAAKGSQYLGQTCWGMTPPHQVLVLFCGIQLPFTLAVCHFRSELVKNILKKHLNVYTRQWSIIELALFVYLCWIFLLQLLLAVSLLRLLSGEPLLKVLFGVFPLQLHLGASFLKVLSGASPLQLLSGRSLLKVFSGASPLWLFSGSSLLQLPTRASFLGLVFGESHLGLFSGASFLQLEPSSILKASSPAILWTWISSLSFCSAASW